MPRRTPSLLLSAVLVTAAGACTAERPTLTETVETTARSTETTVDEHPPSTVAEAAGDAVAVYATEGDDVPASTLLVENQVGKHLVFLVVRDDEDWLQVELPVPGPPTGWLRRSDVKLSTHEYRIEIDRADHRLRAYRGDTSVLDEPVSIGTTDGPKAGTSFFIKELLEPPSPDGPYGRYVYGLSGSANDLSQLQAGAGVLGIHGGSDSSPLGSDIERGCLRLSDAAIGRLVDEIGLPLGTPVEITS